MPDHHRADLLQRRVPVSAGSGSMTFLVAPGEMHGHARTETRKETALRPRLDRVRLVAATVLSLWWLSPAIAAAHHDAPTAGDYSAIDINDVYIFRDPASCLPGPGCKLVVALTTQAVADPLFGSSYHFQENAMYELNFTTRTDARPTATFDVVF